MNKIGIVVTSSPDLIKIEVDDLETFENNKSSLQIGRYIKITQGNSDFSIAVIKNVSGFKSDSDSGRTAWTFLVEAQAIGNLIEDERFERGNIILPVPMEIAYTAGKDTLDKLFISSEEFSFPVGRLSMNKDIELKIDGDKFFGKHVAVIGSTGSGKSCAVASLLQKVVGVEGNTNVNLAEQKNSHIIVFDIHSEYSSAFKLSKDENFTLNSLDVESLKLPYWLMNSEELESLFVESNEMTSHNQISQFKNAVILNKEKHNRNIEEINYDTPVYFSIKEVKNYLENINREVIAKNEGDGRCPKLLDGTLVEDRSDVYFERVREFVETSTKKGEKASKGPFNGDFTRFISRLETKLSDRRLDFILSPNNEEGKPFETQDFAGILKQLLGYINKSNISVVDLSGIPFEVLSITVSLMSRLVFDFCFHYSKMKHKDKLLNDIPVLVVCEEAHNYIPQNSSSQYKASRKSIERIAKEGRKYGLSLMVVSQRPSEVSETIFAQCNNFVALRLTNSRDKGYIENLFPDSSSSVTSNLSNLRAGEAILVGDAVLLPALVQLDIPNPEPQSRSVKVYSEWQGIWKDVSFGDIVRRWRKE